MQSEVSIRALAFFIFILFATVNCSRTKGRNRRSSADKDEDYVPDVKDLKIDESVNLPTSSPISQISHRDALLKNLEQPTGRKEVIIEIEQPNPHQQNRQVKRQYVKRNSRANENSNSRRQTNSRSPPRGNSRSSSAGRRSGVRNNANSISRALQNLNIIMDSSGMCSLDLNKDIAHNNEPLYMVREKNGKLDFARPDLVAIDKSRFDRGISAIRFKEGEHLYLACTGKKNMIVKSDGQHKGKSVRDIEEKNDSKDIQESEYEHVTETTCEKGTKVTLLEEKVTELVDSSHLQCLFPPLSYVIFSKDRTKRVCGNGKGRGLEIGYRVEGWHKLIDVCHNVEEARTLYVTHTLYGTVLAGKVINNHRPNFSRGQKFFYNGFDPNLKYKQTNQWNLLDEITGKPSKYLTKVRYLARGHFAPDADFLFKSWQDATYFYVNVAPQWQTINAGNWLAVENLTRKLAMKLREELSITTGSYGVMKIENVKGEYEELYLHPAKTDKEINRLPVPLYYWKLVRNPKRNECIVLVSTNDPFIEGDVTPFCNNICSSHKWPNNLNDTEKGIVVCCEYHEFKKVVTYAPSVQCSSILTGPED